MPKSVEAVPFYRAALAGKLAPDARRGAFTGLGSTYRTLGRFAEARDTLEQGLAEFPDANEMRVFLAMADHNLGQSRKAVETLLSLLAKTTNDPAIAAYRRAIEFYAQDVDRTWPSGAGE
jgi:thioredoxin-like negative regulator of GroEL